MIHTPILDKISQQKKKKDYNYRYIMDVHWVWSKKKMTKLSEN